MILDTRDLSDLKAMSARVGRAEQALLGRDAEKYRQNL
jgi:hypothetical protein